MANAALASRDRYTHNGLKWKKYTKKSWHVTRLGKPIMNQLLQHVHHHHEHGTRTGTTHPSTSQIRNLISIGNYNDNPLTDFKVDILMVKNILNFFSDNLPPVFNGYFENLDK